MRADYTLSQAVNMVNWIADRIYEHERRCKDCRSAWQYQDGEYCHDGAALYSNRRKWIRRCKLAAKREGSTITV